MIYTDVSVYHNGVPVYNLQFLNLRLGELLAPQRRLGQRRFPDTLGLNIRLDPLYRNDGNGYPLSHLRQHACTVPQSR